MKKLTVLVILLIGVLSFSGCSDYSNVESTLMVNITDSNGAIEDAEVTIAGKEKKTNAEGVAKFILFEGEYDINVTAPNYEETSKTVTVDEKDSSVNITLTTSSTPTAPTTLPAAPTLDSANVISLYNSSGTYTDVTIDNWNPGWGQGGSLTDTTVDGSTVKLLDLVDYQGVDFDTNRIDITGKTTLHISYWTPDATKISIYPIDASGEVQIVTDTLTQGEWAELELDVSSMDDPTTLRQLKFTGQTSIGGANEDGACTIYMDNIYFH